MTLLHASATAGEVFTLLGDYQTLSTFDTRELEVVEIAPDPFPPFAELMDGLAYDPAASRAYVFEGYGLDRYMYEYDLSTRSWAPRYLLQTQGSMWSMSWQPGVGLIGFGVYWAPTVQLLLPTYIDTMIASPLSGADWYPPGGYHLGMNGTTGDFTAVSLGLPPIVLSAWTGAHYSVNGAAYDEDTGVFWTFGGTGVDVNGTIRTVQYAFDPETFIPIARIHNLGSYAASGSRDTVPLQTPELLVTGACPGTIYVTLVDGTPGGQALFASSVPTGPRTITSGPCRGTPIGLRNPQMRGTLPIGNGGLAYTTFESTPGMCGNLHIQALDLDTCTPTQVRTVQTTIIQ